MIHSKISKICVFLLFALAILYVVGKWNSPEWQENPAYQFMAILAIGIVIAIYVVLVILPRVGDVVSTAVLSSNQEIQQDDAMKAAAKMATGDYHSAIQLFEKAAQENPSDPYPISEIAKIYADKIHDHPQAVAYLHDVLANREWSEANAAFILFRLVDLHQQAKEFVDAKSILHQIKELFPDTRFSANATHRLHELDSQAV